MRPALVYAAEKLLPLCRARKMGMLMAGPFNSGILACGPIPRATYFYGDAPPEIPARTAKIQAVCKSFGIPLAAAALQSPLLHEATRSVVVGAATPAQVDQNLELMKIKIPTELWRELQHEGLLADSAPTSGDEAERSDG